MTTSQQCLHNWRGVRGPGEATAPLGGGKPSPWRRRRSRYHRGQRGLATAADRQATRRHDARRPCQSEDASTEGDQPATTGTGSASLANIPMPGARLRDSATPSYPTADYANPGRPHSAPEARGPVNTHSADIGMANRVVSGASGDTHLAHLGVDLSHVGGASSMVWTRNNHWVGFGGGGLVPNRCVRCAQAPVLRVGVSHPTI